jgi:hypothetical protein
LRHHPHTMTIRLSGFCRTSRTLPRTLQSAAPFLFGVLLDRVGIGALGLSAGLCLAAFGSLFLLRPRDAVAARPSPRSSTTFPK